MSRTKLGSIGPAIIVASVVLGPGSILTSSKVGCEFGYDLVWVVIASAVLMVGMTALSARLGVTLDTTPADALAQQFGRAVAVFVGVVLFLVVACFQFSNNVAVVAALEPLVEKGSNVDLVLLVLLNAGMLGALFGFKRLYRPVELLMKALVAVMAVGFLGNLIWAKPSFTKTLAGVVPGLPGEGGSERWLPVLGLVGTTFSVAGAFYQAYLVRKKGWTLSEQRQGLVDSMLGISILALLTLTVMVTAAAVLHGKVASSELHGAEDVAAQLGPLFGPAAKWLFSLGLLAGAFSSFLVNVMIGGTILSDGVGLGGDMDHAWPKRFTAVALLVGMLVAIPVVRTGERPVSLIVFAQAMTVLGNPVLAGALLWLAWRSKPPAPRWMLALGAIGFVVVLVLAVRTAVRVFG